MVIVDQIDVINNCLKKTYENKNSNDNLLPSNDVEMNDLHSYDEKFLFRIKLDEFQCKNNIFINADIRNNYSPHDILYGIFSGDKKFEKLLRILEYDSNGKINLESISRVITANINKSIWYFERDLVATNIQVTTYIEMSLSDMRNVLRSIPDPNICLSPSEYNVDDPKLFLNIVNKSKNLRMFDFIPYVRNHTINSEIIKSHLVYKLADKITLIFVSKKK